MIGVLYMKNLLFSATLLAILLITGCSNDDEQKIEEETKQVSEVEKEQNVKEENAEVKSDIEENQDLTKNIQQEDGVLKGRVYKNKDTAIATIDVDKTVSDKDAKVLAEKYKAELKKVYKDLNISIITKKEGKVVANISESSDSEEKATTETKKNKTSEQNLTVKSLSEQGIISFTTNPISKQISIIIDNTKLDNELSKKKATDFYLVIEGKTYPFAVNPFKETVYEILNTDYTEKQLSSAQVKVK